VLNSSSNMRVSILLALLKPSPAAAFQSVPERASRFCCATRALSPRLSGADDDKSSGPQLGEIVGYTFLAGQLTPALLVGLARLGLIQLPPINTFTAIANNAMEEAVANNEINIYFGTVFGQQKWFELISQYYDDGRTTEFLTRAGGVCAQHAAWCQGVDIPLRGGIVQGP
jgi:hypothetical protein